MLKVRRKTDSLLDWLGDWGGLLDGLTFLVDVLISPYSTYALRSIMASILVKFVPAKKRESNDISPDATK